ncbi:alternative oxidase family protein [Cryptosporidium andersoni]|uniref:Alternative oxidase family protein n=1 Tax=Cryptosporidium andersoni TaxID=117008 RepID=A0A1J4MQN5_9CRYT|nr:alternative oxidase family protein [Cryptosporidium andersoni]
MNFQSNISRNIISNFNQLFFNCNYIKATNKCITTSRYVSTIDTRVGQTSVYSPLHQPSQPHPDKSMNGTHYYHHMNNESQQLYSAPHFRKGIQTLKSEDEGEVKEYSFELPIWNEDEVKNVQITHITPETLIDRLAYSSVLFLRKSFDLLTGYKYGHDERKWCRRIVFLETIAGVPGMVGAMVRHLHSLRRMERDYGWIHTLLEEAENERMHLMISLLLRHPPSLFVRLSVLGAQFGFLIYYTLCYAISPKYCHRFVGYLEEEAVRTYTRLIADIDLGKLPEFTSPAPRCAKLYYGLPKDATLKDVFLAMRRDESHHRDVNHHLAILKPGDPNPFASKV